MKINIFLTERERERDLRGMREREGKTIGEKVEIRRFGKGYGDRGERVKRRELGERDASGEKDKKVDFKIRENGVRKCGGDGVREYG